MKYKQNMSGSDEMTQWKKIEGYENYSVSTNGKVRNDKTGRVLKIFSDKDEYSRVQLYESGEVKTYTIHRLVAEAFVPNPENKPTVDHINRVRTDNRVENLRWATYKEQCEHRVDTKKTPVIASKDGQIYMFESQHECARELGLKQSDVNNCLQGRQKTSKGYTFKLVGV